MNFARLNHLAQGSASADSTPPSDPFTVADFDLLSDLDFAAYRAATDQQQADRQQHAADLLAADFFADADDASDEADYRLVALEMAA